MAEHHELTLEKVKARYETAPEIVAVIVIGSVARGTATPRSDIDLSFVVTSEELERRRSAAELSIDASDLGTWPNAHVGGGLIDVAFLRATAERGPEPARYAFVDARPLFTRNEEIPRLLRRIPVYQERERLEKMRSFVSQLPVHLSYLELGALSQNAWLLSQTAVELVFFAGRLVLAHDRILYGNRKQFMRQLADAPSKPPGMIEMAQALMAAPTIARAHELYDLVMAWRDWPVAPEGAWARYSRDRETNWVHGAPALADS
jgi:predicted nucleotidyltransferase